MANKFLLLILGLALTCSTAIAKSTELLFIAEELAPYHFTNEQGQADGALVELVKATLSQAKLSGDIKIQPLARNFQMVANQSNTFLISLLKSPKRTEQFKWVGASYTSAMALIGLKQRHDIQLTSLCDAKNYRVATIRGYFAAEYLKQHGFKEQQNLSLSVTSKHMWSMLFNSRIDLVLTNYIALNRDIEKAGFKSEQIKPYLTITDIPTTLYIATGKTTSNILVKKLRKALQQVKASGEYQRILDKYNL